MVKLNLIYFAPVPPHIAPKVVYDSGLAKDSGFIPIDRDCKTPFQDVFAIGDVTSLVVTENKAVPKAEFLQKAKVSLLQKILSQNFNQRKNLNCLMEKEDVLLNQDERQHQLLKLICFHNQNLLLVFLNKLLKIFQTN